MEQIMSWEKTGDKRNALKKVFFSKQNRELISRCSEIDLFKKNAHCIAQIPRFHIYAA